MYPRYADRLDAIGIRGIERTYQFAYNKGNPIASPDTPVPKDFDEMWKIASIERYESYGDGKLPHSPDVITHFYDKMLRLCDFESGNRYIDNLRLTGRDAFLQVMEKYMKHELTHDWLREYTGLVLNEQGKLEKKR